MTRERTLDLLSKLRAMAEQTASPEEAAIAAARMQAIMREHRISELELDDHATDEDTIIARDLLGQQKTVVTWRRSLLGAIATYGGCRVVYQSARRAYGYTQQGKLHLIGRTSDVEACSYLYAYLIREIDRLTREHGEGLGKRWATAFRLGCVVTLATRLQEQAAQIEQTETATTTALVRKADTAVKTWVSKHYNRLHKPPHVQVFDGGAYNEGRAAGGSIRLQADDAKGINAPAPRLRGDV